MTTDEEYLDSLLRDVTANEPKPRTMEEVMREMSKTSKRDANFPVSSDELADMLDEIEKNEQIYEPLGEEAIEKSPALPEAIPEAMPEIMPEAIPEAMPEIIPEASPEEMLMEAPAEMPEETPAEMPVEIPAEFMDVLSEELPAEALEEFSQEALLGDEIEQLLQAEESSVLEEVLPAEMPTEFTEAMPEIMPEAISEEMLMEVPAEIPEETPAEMSVEMPTEFMEAISEAIPETMPEEFPQEDTVPEEIAQLLQTEEIPMEAGEEAAPETDEEAPPEEWQADLDALLANAEAQANEAELAEAASEEPDGASIEEMMPVAMEEAIPVVPEGDELDVTALIDGMDQSDDDLAEISGLLKKADNNEAVEDDMMALLGEIGGDTQADQAADTQISAGEEGGLPEGDTEPEKGKKSRKKKEKKERRKLFGKKDKRKEQEENAAGDVQNETPDTLSPDEMLADGLAIDDILSDEIGIEERAAGASAEDAEEQGSGKKKKEKKEKKENFLVRFFTFLTREEDDLAQMLDENAEIIKELNEEDDQKAKKEEKKRKKTEKKSKKGKGKKGEKAADEEEGGEEDAAGDEGEGGKKKKKEKKEKKEKKPKEKSTEKSKKVLSRKALLVLIAFCATLIASISILSYFLPEYADRKNAQAAFYQGDYEEAYKLLYDKRLNGSDELIFNRVMNVLKLQRKIDSYENNLVLDRKVEALDALLRGVQAYQEMKEVDIRGGREEVDEIYRQICSLLEQNYRITEQDALGILEYEDVVYTQKLYSVVFGTDFSLPGEPVQEDDATLQSGDMSEENGVEGSTGDDSGILQDVLPEEEALIGD